MPNYVQYFPSGLCHTILDSAGELQGVGIVEVSDFDVWYVGARYDGAWFRRLEITGGVVAVGAILDVVIRWVSKSGFVFPVDGPVTVKHGAVSEVVQLFNGQGVMPFQAAEAGTYKLVATSPEGCRAECEVIVS